jgi:Family of unknown function (DUF6636)
MRALIALAAVLGSLVAPPSASAAVFFHSPSGNIRCYLDRTSFTRCDITNREWSPPPKPDSCEFDWGNSLGLGFRGRGHFICVSDAVDMGRRLDYGEAIRRGRFRCRSRVTGMRCVNLRNGHGFALSRQRVRRF